jgi:hypothetical protein
MMDLPKSSLKHVRLRILPDDGPRLDPFRVDDGVGGVAAEMDRLSAGDGRRLVLGGELVRQ